MERSSGSPRELPQVIEQCHRTLLWMIPVIERMPRQRRFTMGERLETGLLDVLSLLVDAAYRSDKQASLQAANRKLAVLRHLWRVASELKVLSVNHYEQGAQHLVDLGRQTGGWLKSVRI